MPLDKTTLKSSLDTLFTDLSAFDGSVGKTQADAITKLKDDLADAIEVYVKSGDVGSVETRLDSSLNTIFNAGTPVANDGGLALQVAWKAATAAAAKDDATTRAGTVGKIT